MEEQDGVSLERTCLSATFSPFTYPIFQIPLPHAYDDSPYVDILQFLEEEHEKKQAEEMEDEVRRIVEIRMKKIQANFKAKDRARIDWLNAEQIRRQQKFADRVVINRKMIAETRKSEAHPNPVFPEKDDKLIHRDPYWQRLNTYIEYQIFLDYILVYFIHCLLK